MADQSSELSPRYLEILNEVARIATLDLELRPMLQRITDALSEKFGWEFVALVMVDPLRGVFVCEALTTRIPTEIFVGYSRALGSGVVGKVAVTQQPIVLDEISDDPDYIETTAGVRSEICVPVKHGATLVGILNIESTQSRAFHGQLELLTTVARQIAGAIASARMIEELRRRARLMELMSELSRSALEAESLQGLLDRIVGFIGAHFPLNLVSILLLEPESRTLNERASHGGGRRPERDPLGVAERCIASRKTEVVIDVPVTGGTLSILSAPIVFRDEVVGCLKLESATSDVFTPANVVAFEAFANQVAGAIHVTKLNDLLGEKSRGLEEANRHLARAIETLHRLSTTDSLTGIANRRRFDETLDAEWRRAARSHTPLSMLMIDIDEFKAFNDLYGHQRGDECLTSVAGELERRFHRASDLVARYGGEEFAVLLPATASGNAFELAEAARRGVAALKLEHAASPTGAVTISVGSATVIPYRELRPTQLLRAADDALYRAKREGRNRVVVSVAERVIDESRR